MADKLPQPPMDRIKLRVRTLTTLRMERGRLHGESQPSAGRSCVARHAHQPIVGFVKGGRAVGPRGMGTCHFMHQRDRGVDKGGHDGTGGGHGVDIAKGLILQRLIEKWDTTLPPRGGHGQRQVYAHGWATGDTADRSGTARRNREMWSFTKCGLRNHAHGLARMASTRVPLRHRIAARPRTGINVLTLGSNRRTSSGGFAEDMRVSPINNFISALPSAPRTRA